MTRRLLYCSTSEIIPSRGAYHLLPLKSIVLGCVLCDAPGLMRAELSSKGAHVWPHMLDQSPLPEGLLTALQNHGVPVTATDTAFSALRKTFDVVGWPALDPDHF